MHNIIYIFAYIGISYILYLILYFSMLWRESFEKKHYNTDYGLGIAIGGFSINALSHIIAGICIITILPFAMTSVHSWMRLRNDKKKPLVQADDSDFIQRFKDEHNNDFEDDTEEIALAETKPITSIDEVTCQSCGNEINKDNRFCEWCGAVTRK